MKSHVHASIILVAVIAFVALGAWALLRTTDTNRTTEDDLVEQDTDVSEISVVDIEDDTVSFGLVRFEVGDDFSTLERHGAGSDLMRTYFQPGGVDRISITDIWRLNESSRDQIGGTQVAAMSVLGDAGLQYLIEMTQTDTSVAVNTDTEYSINNIDWVASGQYICFVSAGSYTCFDPQWYGVDGSNAAELESFLKRFSQPEPAPL